MALTKRWLMWSSYQVTEAACRTFRELNPTPPTPPHNASRRPPNRKHATTLEVVVYIPKWRRHHRTPIR